MARIEKLLDTLINLLEKEKELIILSVKNPELSSELEKTIEEKRNVLSKLANFSPEDFKGSEEKLLKIKDLSNINLHIAVSNAQFIEEIFSAIFDEPQKYDQSGTVKQSQKGLFNKKI